MEENIFPSQMSMYDREDLEEERGFFMWPLHALKKNSILVLPITVIDLDLLYKTIPADLLTNCLPIWLTIASPLKPRFNTPKSKGLFGNENAIQQKKVVNHHTTAVHTCHRSI
jgi:hypothetical protein